MSGSLLYIFLKRLNPNVEIIPLIHNTKSHGLSDKEIFNWLKTQPPSLIITPDSSVNDTKECKVLTKLGFEILIGGEHHIIEHDNPYATIVSNQIGEIDNRHGSGGLVTWHMCRHVDRDLVKDLISYVTISLIGDSMDMTTEENYTFTKWGKQKIHPYLVPFVEQLNRDGDTIECRSYSYGMIVCLNSLIRLGTLEDKQQLFQALCGEIDPTDIIAKCKSYHTQQSNQSRKMVEDVEIVNNSSVVIGRLYEKTTMTGLIAGKLMSKYGKPVLLGHENNGEFSGSVRSPIDLKELLSDSGLTSFQAGHSRSCGFGYPLSNEQAIIDYLDGVIVDCEPCADVLASLMITNIPNSLFSFKEDYRHIFGKGLDTYNVHIKPFTIYNTDIQSLGRGNTIKFNSNGLDFIMFFTSNEMKERLYMNVKDKVKVKLKIECIVELGWNIWNGKKSKQAIIQSFECEKVDEDEIDWSTVWG